MSVYGNRQRLRFIKFEHPVVLINAICFSELWRKGPRSCGWFSDLALFADHSNENLINPGRLIKWVDNSQGNTSFADIYHWFGNGESFPFYKYICFFIHFTSWPRLFSLVIKINFQWCLRIFWPPSAFDPNGEEIHNLIWRYKCDKEHYHIYIYLKGPYVVVKHGTKLSKKSVTLTRYILQERYIVALVDFCVFFIS